MPDIPKYQKDYSLSKPIMLQAELRSIKVEKMLSVLKDTGIMDRKNDLALDVGCSGGYFIEGMTPYFNTVLGFDIDIHALTSANKTDKSENLVYVAADSMNMPLMDNSVDLVICNHVYEHVPDAEELFSEIFRVLRKDGLCYFGAVSRLSVIEPHYFLPFLSWFPKKLSHLYMRLAKKGDYYYEKPRTYWGLKKLINNFQVDDYTLEIVANPDKYHARDLFPEKGVLSKIPMFVWKIFYYFLPGYIFILKK